MMNYDDQHKYSDNSGTVWNLTYVSLLIIDQDKTNRPDTYLKGITVSRLSIHIH